MAIHTSLSRPATEQPILYTDTFVVDRSQALPPAGKLLKNANYAY